MARLTDDDFAALDRQRTLAEASPLGALRRTSGEHRSGRTRAWLDAGDTLAEKAVAALDAGDEARAARLVARIIGLPPVDGADRSGLMAVGLLLFGELVDPLDDAAEAGLLEAPLRLLPELDPVVGTELLRVLAGIAEFDLPAAIRRRIRAVADPALTGEPAFAGVAEERLPEAVTGVLGLVLRLRAG